MISTISLNFHRADLSVRSVLQFSREDLTAIYQGLKGRVGLNGLLILTTCNRTEVYADHESWFDIRTLLDYLQQYKGTAVPLHQFDMIGNTPLAINYIVEVANGLYSMVIGDKQILGQLKDAFRLSQANGMISGMLERVFQLLIRSHKRVANETGYHSGSRSVSHLAIREIRQWKSKRNVPVLVIGAGEIAHDMVKYLYGNDHSDVTIMNRTLERSQMLASRYDFKYQPFVLDQKSLDPYKVIISCAAVKGLLRDDILMGMSSKLLIDLTIDQSISVSQDSLHKLITLDDLGLKEAEGTQERTMEIEQARAIISQEHSAFMEWMRQRELRRNKQIMFA